MRTEIITGIGCRIHKYNLTHYIYLDEGDKFKFVNYRFVLLNSEKKFNGLTIDEMKLLF